MGRYPNISDHGLIGDLQMAALTFQKMHTYANHPGLYPEEIGRTGGQFGNLPQAFSHLAPPAGPASHQRGASASPITAPPPHPRSLRRLTRHG